MSKEKFQEEISAGYEHEGESIIMGAAKYQDEVITEAFVRLPLGTLNRHGLIAGATGTGKTKTLQIVAEQLSAKGVPSLVMDIKGDLSGIAAESPGHAKIDERHEMIGLPFIADTSPVEFLTLSDEPGARLRATVTEFGPVLFSKILDLNDTQSGIISILFKYCDDAAIPLLDLKDVRKLLQYVGGPGKEEFEAEYGRISSASTGAIMRKIVELEQQDGDRFFGERSFDVHDLTRHTPDGRGIVSILRVTDVQDKPKLFSTFMLQMLAEIYSTFPEEGDLDKPKLVLFIDEAHLVFNEASDVLLDQIETVIKLIRSKGIGIIFITQNPADIPEEVLGQLGMKIQHALRAFTAKDRKAIKLAAQNYPLSDHYDVEEIITQLGIGEALFTALNEDGIPTPLVHTYLRAPQSRMDVLSDREIQDIISRSVIMPKYDEEIDRESAYEILGGKLEEAEQEENNTTKKAEHEKARKSSRREKQGLERYVDKTTQRQIGRTVAREITRGVLGVLGIRTTRRRSRSKSWF